MIRFLLLFCLFSRSVVYSQVGGRVFDVENHQSLEGAQVLVNRELWAVSAADGSFHVQGLAPGDTIQIVLPGYRSFVFAYRSLDSYLLVGLSTDVHAIHEVVVAAPVLSSRLKGIASSVFVLGREELDRSASLDVLAPLSQVPGVHVQTGAYSTRRIVIRGIGSRTPYSTNRVRAFWDDIPLTSGDGITSLEDIDLSSVGRVEVMKGPSSSFHGSGLGGTVLIHSVFPENEGTSVNLRSGVSSFGGFDNAVMIKSRWNQFALVAAIHGASLEGYRENSTMNKTSAFINTKWYGKKLQLSFTGHFVHLKAYIPSSIDSLTFISNPRAAAANWKQIRGFEDYRRGIAGISIVYPSSSVWNHAFTMYTGFFDQLESRPFNILDDRSLNYGVRYRARYMINHWKVAAGGEWFRENYHWSLFQTLSGTQGNEFARARENRQYLNTYLVAIFSPLDRLNLEAGANLHWLQYTLEDAFNPPSQAISGSYQYKPVVSPRVGVNYRIGPRTNLYGSAGHGFSAPSVEETLMPDGQLNTSIKPEDGLHLELGSRTAFDPVTFDIAVYRVYARNLLVTKRLAEDIFTGINAGRTLHDGLEIDATIRLVTPRDATGSASRLRIAYTLSRDRFIDFVDDGNDYSGNALPGIPAHTLSAGLDYFWFPGFGSMLEFEHLGKQFLDDANNKLYQGYGLFHFRVIYEKSLSRHTGIDFRLGVNNILNTHHASMVLINAITPPSGNPRYYYSGLPRNYFARLTFRFGSRPRNN